MEIDTLDTLSGRLLFALELTGTKKADLARAINVQPQTLSHLCHGKVVSSRFTFEIATVLGLSTRWLATGEGEMFLADDPKHKLFKEYTKIPLLDNSELVKLAENKTIMNDQYRNWAVLKTTELNIFCATLMDASMTPFLQPNAQIFFKLLVDPKKINTMNEEIVIAYLPKFNSIMVREIIMANNKLYLSPFNKNHFKEFELTSDITIFGQAIECHFKINKGKSL